VSLYGGINGAIGENSPCFLFLVVSGIYVFIAGTAKAPCLASRL